MYMIISAKRGRRLLINLIVSQYPHFRSPVRESSTRHSGGHGGYPMVKAVYLSEEIELCATYDQPHF